MSVAPPLLFYKTAQALSLPPRPQISTPVTTLHSANQVHSCSDISVSTFGALAKRTLALFNANFRLISTRFLSFSHFPLVSKIILKYLILFVVFISSVYCPYISLLLPP
jgi:hypothetical protein